MEKSQIIEIAKNYTRKLGYCENTVEKVNIMFRSKQRNLGMCRPRQKRIIFNSNHLSETSEWWHALIAHEIAHFKVHGHNKRFREVLAFLNQSALATNSKRTYCSIEDCITAGINATFKGE